MKTKLLNKEFFQDKTSKVAANLLGKILVHEINGTILSGKIIETEAYGGFEDAASHAARGQDKRNSPMFEEVGCAYVYLSYGVHYCFNIVAREKNAFAGAVLIRAIEPLSGIEQMILQRSLFLKSKIKLQDLTNLYKQPEPSLLLNQKIVQNLNNQEPAKKSNFKNLTAEKEYQKILKNLANGPGKLTQALGINITHNRIDLTKKNSLYILSSPNEPKFCLFTPRIGITKNKKAPWRFLFIDLEKSKIPKKSRK